MPQGITQHHGQGKDGGQGIGDTLAGDVRGRAVDGLVHAAAALVQGGRGQHADGAGQHGGSVGEDVAEDIAGHHDIELLGPPHQLHGGVVHVHMAQLDVGVFILDHPRRHLAPQLGAFQDVGLIHGADPAVALAGNVAGDADDAFDLMLGIDHGVETLALATLQGAHPARLAEVDVAGQLAHDEDIEPGDDLGLEGRGLRQLRIEDGRAQVGEEPQAGTQPQQPLLRADADVQRLPLGAAHGAQQHRVGLLCHLQGDIGQRNAGGVDGRPAHQGLVHLDLQAVVVPQGRQHLDRLGHNFRPDTVAGQNQNVFAHTKTPYLTAKDAKIAKDQTLFTMRLMPSLMRLTLKFNK